MVQSHFVGMREIKGKSEPQRVFQLNALRTGAVRFDAVLSRGLTTFSPFAANLWDSRRASGRRRSHSEQGRQQRRAGVHPDREHVAPCQPRGRSDTRQTNGNAQRPRQSRFSQQLYEHPCCRYSSVLQTLAKSRSRVHHGAEAEVRRDALLHSRS
jgi:hypothetical protein